MLAQEPEWEGLSSPGPAASFVPGVPDSALAGAAQLQVLQDTQDRYLGRDGGHQAHRSSQHAAAVQGLETKESRWSLTLP